MYASDCIKDPDTIYFKCLSRNMYESSCYCAKKSNNIGSEVQFIPNDQLYKDLYFKDVDQGNSREHWEPTSGMRILDCLSLKHNPEWTCLTYDSFKNKTICTCYTDASLGSPDRAAYAALKTTDLYKNLDNEYIDFTSLQSSHISSKSNKIEFSFNENSDHNIIHDSSQNIPQDQTLFKFKNNICILTILPFILLFLWILIMFLYRKLKQNYFYKKIRYITGHRNIKYMYLQNSKF